jgi:hypothetical protein
MEVGVIQTVKASESAPPTFRLRSRYERPRGYSHREPLFLLGWRPYGLDKKNPICPNPITSLDHIRETEAAFKTAARSHFASVQKANPTISLSLICGLRIEKDM